ncbi:MAG: ABC transporter ATP-binding protein [Candidatus Taylorbacteria bacterium]|nr:ABC transporter ATP-binding protein [Candidatus Taylorbacteria bacterium]
MKKTNSIRGLVRSVFRSVKLSMKYAPWLTSIMAGTFVISYSLPLLQSKILGSIIDKLIEALTKNPGTSSVTFLVILYASVWIGSKLVSEIRLFVDKKWSLEIEQNLEISVMKKRAELDLATHEDPKFQDLMQNAFSRGIWPIYQLVDYQFRNTGNIVLIILSSVIASTISWKLYLVALISAIPTFYVQLKYGNETWTIWAENSPRKRVYEHIRMHLRSRTGIQQGKLLQATQRLLNQATKILSDFKLEQEKVDLKRMLLSMAAGVISAGGFGYAMYLLVQDVSLGKITPGTLVFLVGVLSQLVSSISGLLESMAQQYEKNLYASDIFKFFDTESRVKDVENPTVLKLEKAPTIEFRNVSFKYDGRDDLILDNVSFTIESGEHVALVGQNGAGKSTLIKLMMRIYNPTSGDILINGINLKDIQGESWIRYVSVLLQKYIVHEFKVRDAISIGRSEVPHSDELAESSAILSGAHDFVKDYKHGYSQQLGKEFEEGIEPSQGQEQKIALARTLYRLDMGYLLILDEPTAAIDPLAETEIFESMEKATVGKNLVLITHRFNTVKDVDKIIVLEHGKIVEIGDHDSLMKKNGHYKEMFESQAKGFIEGSRV